MVLITVLLFLIFIEIISIGIHISKQLFDIRDAIERQSFLKREKG